MTKYNQMQGLVHEATLECIATGRCEPDRATMMEVADWAIREVYQLRKEIVDEKTRYLTVIQQTLDRADAETGGAAPPEATSWETTNSGDDREESDG